MVETLTNFLKKIPKQYYFPLFMAILGVIFFGYGLIQYLGSSQHGKAETTLADVTTPTHVKTVKSISVDVEGAVFHTGVFTVPQDSRLQDALIKAGGLNEDADRDFVAKHINLASKLQDGAKIYIPRVGENILEGASTVNTDNGVAVVFININTTTPEMLDSLPGIGPTTAQKIITNRPYASIQDLVTKKIVSQKIFDQIKDKIVAE